jgi:hypothetical protein
MESISSVHNNENAQKTSIVSLMKEIAKEFRSLDDTAWTLLLEKWDILWYKQTLRSKALLIPKMVNDVKAIIWTTNNENFNQLINELDTMDAYVKRVLSASNDLYTTFQLDQLLIKSKADPQDPLILELLIEKFNQAA